MGMGKRVKRERAVWLAVAVLLLIAVCVSLWLWLDNRLPAKYAVLRGVLVEDVDINKETGTATMTLSGDGDTRLVWFKANVKVYHWNEVPMDLAELTAGKEIEVFVDPYDTAAPPSVHDRCYRIIVCDGPVPSAALI